MQKNDLSTHTNQELEAVRQWLGTGSLNLFGLPLAGKDTQSHRLATHLQAPVISGGDVLRTREDIPEEVRKVTDAGELTPTEFFVQLMIPYLEREEFARSPLILSSLGRWKGEEMPIRQAAEAAGHPIKAVVLLHLDEATIRERWQRHREEGSARGERADDHADALEVRLEEFRNKTVPVINYYREEGLLIEIDGAASPARVESQIIAALYQKSLQN